MHPEEFRGTTVSFYLALRGLKGGDDMCALGFFQGKQSRGAMIQLG